MDKQIAVEFLGIAFRSEGHMHWFKFSMIVLLVSVAWAGLFAAIGHWVKLAGLYCAGLIVPAKAAIMHLLVSGQAILMTKGGQIDGPLYSSDCIWFNALMAGVQGGLGLIVLIVGLRAYSLDKTRKKAPRG